MERVLLATAQFSLHNLLLTRAINFWFVLLWLVWVLLTMLYSQLLRVQCMCAQKKRTKRRLPVCLYQQSSQQCSLVLPNQFCLRSFLLLRGCTSWFMHLWQAWQKFCANGWVCRFSRVISRILYHSYCVLKN